MTNLTELAETMQALLTTDADDLARQTGFVIRQRKVSGSNFAQTVVFSALAGPDATRSRRLNTAATVGLVITDKGLAKRFDARAAAFLRAMLRAAVSKGITAPVAIPLLQRFTAVEVLDGSTIALPDALAAVFRGGRSGTTTGAKAAVKITVGLDLLSGRLSGPELSDGRAADLSAGFGRGRSARRRPAPGRLELLRAGEVRPLGRVRRVLAVAAQERHGGVRRRRPADRPGLLAPGRGRRRGRPRRGARQPAAAGLPADRPPGPRRGGRAAAATAPGQEPATRGQAQRAEPGVVRRGRSW